MVYSFSRISYFDSLYHYCNIAILHRYSYSYSYSYILYICWIFFSLFFVNLFLTVFALSCVLFFVYMQTLYPSNPSPLLREGIVLYTCSYRTSSTSLFVYHPFFVLYCNIIHLQFLFSITLSIIRRYFCISLLFFITHDNLLLSFKLFLFFCTLHSFFSFESWRGGGGCLSLSCIVLW